MPAAGGVLSLHLDKSVRVAEILTRLESFFRRHSDHSGGLATWPLLAHHDEYKWFTGVCALLAGFSPALYKALDFDVSLKVIAQYAHEFKILQDRFRQAWRISGLGPFADFKKEFDELMTRMDAVRAASLTPPER